MHLFVSITFSLNVGPNHTALIEGEQAHPAPKGGEATYAPRVHQQPHVQTIICGKSGGGEGRGWVEENEEKEEEEEEEEESRTPNMSIIFTIPLPHAGRFV